MQISGAISALVSMGIFKTLGSGAMNVFNDRWSYMYDTVSMLREEASSLGYQAADLVDLRKMLCIDPANPTAFEQELIDNFISKNHFMAMRDIDSTLLEGDGHYPTIEGKRFVIEGHNLDGTPRVSTSDG
jgi:hypothetical protein